MNSAETSAAERRVWARMPSGARAALGDLSSTDLQTLLLAVARTRAATVSPADLLRKWRENRFVRPAASDPRAVAEVEAQLWRLLPAEFEGVELSPVVPLGTCSAIAPLNQNRIVTTIRTTEVLSDASNALAIEAAHRRQQQSAAGEVHLAASHRLLRAQVFSAGMAAHFRLFTLVSSARDVGSGRTQARLLGRHLAYWQSVLAAFLGTAEPQIRLTVLDSPVMRERLNDTVLPTLAELGTTVPVVENSAREWGRGYYVDAALQITAHDGGHTVELGDGGFTTWTGQILNNAKERCLISCLSTERLTALADNGGRTSADATTHR
jgi:hypothetical protein